MRCAIPIIRWKTNFFYNILLVYQCARGVEAGGGEDEGGGRQRRRRSQGRRRSVTWARAAGLWAATSTAAVLGELERWGEQGERTAGGRKGEGGRKLGNIWGGAFCPGWSHHPGQNDLLSRWWIHPGQKAPPFVPGETTTRDKRTFCPGWWLHPGQKGFLGGPGKFPARGPPLVPGGSTTRDKRGPFSLVPA